jgi:hypothetical protein
VVCAGLLTASAVARLRRDGWLGAIPSRVAWVAMVGGALVVLSEIELQRSRNAAAGGEIVAGIDRAERRTVTPWSAGHLQLALLGRSRATTRHGELRQAEAGTPRIGASR